MSKKSCDFASTGSRKVKNGQDLASTGDQVPKSNVTLLLWGSTYQNFESGDNFSLVLVSEDHETIQFMIYF